MTYIIIGIITVIFLYDLATPLKESLLLGSSYANPTGSINSLPCAVFYNFFIKVLKINFFIFFKLFFTNKKGLKNYTLARIFEMLFKNNFIFKNKVYFFKKNNFLLLFFKKKGPKRPHRSSVTLAYKQVPDLRPFLGQVFNKKLKIFIKKLIF